MADTFDVTKQAPAGGGVNKPTSGTYGEGAALDRLKQSFPVTPPGAGPGSSSGQPAPMPTPPSGGVAAPQSGLPPALLRPTAQPGVPASTPLAPAPVNPVAQAASRRQANMARLDALVNSPNVSEVTKQWAQNVLDHLTRGAPQ